MEILEAVEEESAKMGMGYCGRLCGSGRTSFLSRCFLGASRSTAT
jgi:hypothetical protein